MTHIDEIPVDDDRPLAERVRLAPGIARSVSYWTTDPLAERTLQTLAALVEEMAADALAARNELAKLRMAQPQAPRLEGDG